MCSPARYGPCGLASVRAALQCENTCSLAAQTVHNRTGGRAAMDLTKRQQEIFDFIRNTRDTGIRRPCATSARLLDSPPPRLCMRISQTWRRSACCAAILSSRERSSCSTARGEARWKACADRALRGLPLVGSVAPVSGPRRREHRGHVSVPELAGGAMAATCCAFAATREGRCILEANYVVCAPPGHRQDGDVRVALLGRGGDRGSASSRERSCASAARKRRDGSRSQQVKVLVGSSVCSGLSDPPAKPCLRSRRPRTLHRGRMKR